jgi:stage II sporulation protein P
VRRITTINGKKTAQLMFFNGLSRNRKGDITYLKNDNLQANLAFSLQMKLKCMELYPNLAKPIYLKSYRYNLHLRKRSMLLELGNENNTLEEAKNAMPPLAKILEQVLSGK